MGVDLFRAHLAADDVSKELLQAHARKEYCGDENYVFNVKQAEVKFHTLASRLGFRVEKIETASEIAA